MTKEKLNVRDVVQVFEKWSPKELAYDWDNVGLQIGNYENQVKRLMVTLDVLENVVDEAVENDVDMIIAHHPLLFKSVKQIDMTSPKGRTIEKIIKNDITVYAAHTNLDMAFGGVSDILAQKLGLNDTKVLVKSHSEMLYKFVVYVPEDHAGKVRDEVGNTGAGHIGNYSHCFFSTSGEGSFLPLEGTNPYIGAQGEVAKVKEVKLETIVRESQLKIAIDAMKRVHPYEEPAFDLFPLNNNGITFGVGRVGELPESLSLRTLCERVKQRLNIPGLRVAGNLDAEVKKIALLGGSGEDFIGHAHKSGADVYITGDLTFHETQDAWQMGLNLIDPGHHVEKVMKEAVQSYLQAELQEKVEVIVSESNTEPFKFL
ncbi:Nif3-like dinuclear metal center hexameric protein [Sediminibacillus massiliensis]|uniref:Nif3-like dinuclear metal center hexameric protein n=1 Tax=Sediminibacillus massiliensis TaxID=1926277 RepID=UPI0009888810|nr:Nif3-like dinuclear metal center hexameric protein [Sediminibacillus massiliensis]